MHPNFQKLLQRHKKLYRVRKHFSANIESIINKIAEDTGLNKQEIYHIISAQFAMVQDVIFTSNDGDELAEFENYKSIRLIYLGAFIPSKTKFNKLIPKINKK